MVYRLKMVIFHGYVKLPEGNACLVEMSDIFATDHMQPVYKITFWYQFDRCFQ